MGLNKLKWLAVLAAAIVLLCGAASAEGIVASGSCGAEGDNLAWTLDDAGTLTISGEGNMASMSGGRPWAEHFLSVETLVIEDGVTGLGNSAFQGLVNLENVIFEGGGIISDYHAFLNCSALENVYAPTLQHWLSMDFGSEYSSPMDIARNLYIGGVLLEEAVVPEGTTVIPRVAFKNCKNLKSVTIPDGVVKIGIGAFSQCSGLTEIHIPQGVRTIGSSAFTGCTGLTGITIPEGVAEIGDAAFYNCANLRSVSLPGSLEVLSSGAFQYCKSLESIVIPAGVTEIAAYTFDRCTSLAEVRLPDGITSIGMYAFYKCASLKQIDIPSACTKISSYAFENCDGLTSIYLPPAVTNVGAEAFAYCDNLAVVTITGRYTYFSAYAFSGCKNLKYLLADNADAAGSLWHDKAFVNYYPVVYCYKDSMAYNCAWSDGLKTVFIDGMDKSSVWEIALAQSRVVESGKEVQLNAVPFPAYDAPLQFSSTAPDVILVEDGRLIARAKGEATITVTAQGGAAAECSVTVCGFLALPAGAKQVEDEAFANIGAYSCIILPSGCETIGARAFADNPTLISVYMPNSVTSIAENAFEGCANVYFICESENPAAEFADAQGIPYFVE